MLYRALSSYVAHGKFGEVELSIKSDAKTGQQYHKWLFAFSEILCKIGIGFISNFLLKARFLYLQVLKRKNLNLPLKVETDQFVICLVLPECLSVKICCISPSNSKANRDGADAESPFRFVFSFSASFKNSSLREKIGNRLHFGNGGWSLCFCPLLPRNIMFFPTLTMAARTKKNSGKPIWSRNQHALTRFWARLRILNLIARLC